MCRSHFGAQTCFVTTCCHFVQIIRNYRCHFVQIIRIIIRIIITENYIEKHLAFKKQCEYS